MHSGAKPLQAALRKRQRLRRAVEDTRQQLRAMEAELGFLEEQFAKNPYELLEDTLGGRLLNGLLQRPGRSFTAQELAEELGIPKYRKRSVQTTLARISTIYGHLVERPQRGRYRARVGFKLEEVNATG